MAPNIFVFCLGLFAGGLGMILFLMFTGDI